MFVVGDKVTVNKEYAEAYLLDLVGRVIDVEEKEGADGSTHKDYLVYFKILKDKIGFTELISDYALLYSPLNLENTIVDAVERLKNDNCFLETSSISKDKVELVFCVNVKLIAKFVEEDDYNFLYTTMDGDLEVDNAEVSEDLFIRTTYNVFAKVKDLNAKYQGKATFELSDCLEIDCTIDANSLWAKKLLTVTLDRETLTKEEMYVVLMGIKTDIDGGV